MKKITDFASAKSKQRFSLTFTFATVVFIVLLAAILFAAILLFVFSKTGVIGGFEDELSLGTILLCVLAFSIISGAIISLLLALIPLKPLNRYIDHMNKLAEGDFKVRLKFNSSWADHKTFREISDSFNKLAEELENTEMLRADFINNFSHEFKTPIVSIAGLAKLVNRGSLTEEERTRYLTAIEDESLRLAAMATNVLNLTKVENQSILTGTKVFNLSEQLRSSVLLLENKWVKKDVNLEIDFDEFFVEADEELLKEVWINILDNAIKFTSHGGTVAIKIEDTDRSLSVAISNTESEISDEDKKKIFAKFYQADKSHAAEGNGVGLAIVKKIVDLHKGNIEVFSENRVVNFKVTVPKKQSKL
ncbi:MAG: HAMP domain-containing histidine kinase [Clostridia bacterium]|nr:HAMP domain-containing histidine kinase [Clostridia bacterium]